MPSEPESRFYPRVFALVTAAILCVAVWKILQPFIGAILWSILLAFLLYPVNRRLRDVLGGRPAAAAILLTLGFIVILLGPALAVSVTFVNQATALFKQLQATAGRYEIARPSDLLRIPFVHQFLQWAETVTPVSAEQVQDWLMSAATGLLQVAVAMSGVFVVEALGTLVSLLITLFLLFFFLRDGEAMLDTALRLVPLDAERQGHLLLHLSAVTRASDNVVRPLFISGRAQISALPVFLGLAGGLSAFGPIGIVLGPVIVALVLALVRFAEESRQPVVIAAGDEESHEPSVRVAGGDG